ITELPVIEPPNPSGPSTNEITPKPALPGTIVVFASVEKFAFWIVLLNEPFVTSTALLAKFGVAFVIVSDRFGVPFVVLLLPSIVMPLTAESSTKIAGKFCGIPLKFARPTSVDDPLAAAWIRTGHVGLMPSAGMNTI